MQQIKLLVADDQELDRTGLAELLQRTETLKIIDHAASASEAVEKAINLDVDIVLMDINWFGNKESGINAIREIKLQSPGTKVIVLSNFSDELARATRAGADEAISKGFSKEELVAIINAVFRKSFSARPQAAAEQEPNGEKLTDRERVVLELISRGMSDRQIAQHLSISVHTSKHHVASTINKLGATNRAQAVTIGLDRGLIKKGIGPAIE